MFSGKRPPRPPTGTIVGRRQKSTLDLVEQLSRIQGGQGATWTPAGPFLHQPGTLFRIGQTTGSGISGRSDSTLGFGTVNEYTLNQTAPTAATINVSTGGTTFVAFNFSAAPIGDSSPKFVVCAVIWGLWLVISAEC